ncbi:rCG20951 [Rattus norvegicus]|uniref:RCG20951 n=1 Tax=Rattus norvegicus TaxID=10116 RepID=A6JDP7_RAT|nr:rCG20951 [Rattus norvegicus]
MAVYATVPPPHGDAFFLSRMSSPGLVTPTVKDAVMSPPCLRDVWDFLIFQYWRGSCAHLPLLHGDTLVLTP